MPELDGITFLRQAAIADRDVIGIVMTGHGTIETAVQAIKAGAFDYVQKPFRMRSVLPVLSRALEVRELRVQNAALHASVDKRTQELEKANRELWETQAQLVQAAKMASLGELVAGVAHEINNPLAFVLSHQQTVERTLDAISLGTDHREQNNLEKARDRARSMSAGLERIAAIVKNLRTFSRMDEGELKRIDVLESINSVLDLLRHRVHDSVSIAVRCDEPRFVPCFPGPLNQVLMNVLGNALDAVGGEGSVTIETKTTGRWFDIVVRDDGVGIPEHDLPRVMEPFYTTKPVGEGTGLGLAISYGIIQSHGGTLHLDSVEGEGTRVHIRIPVDGASPRQGPAQTNRNDDS
jgi:two-component system NtrC family sensor kinase